MKEKATKQPVSKSELERIKREREKVIRNHKLIKK
jgi:hypothetical protein